jgi:hypothetical protein
MTKVQKTNLAFCIGLMVVVHIVFRVMGGFVGLALIAAILVMSHTQGGNKFMANVKRFCLIQWYTHVIPWFNANKEHPFFKYFENAKWFTWYGRNVVNVESKKDSDLTDVEKNVKASIIAKDYTTAWELIKDMPASPKRDTLEQMIESKLSDQTPRDRSDY